MLTALVKNDGDHKKLILENFVIVIKDRLRAEIQYHKFSEILDMGDNPKTRKIIQEQFKDERYTEEVKMSTKVQKKMFSLIKTLASDGVDFAKD